VIKQDGAKNWVGQPLPRKEENRLLRGRGRFADDIKLREMLYLRFVRSPFAHAKIVQVDVSAAEALAGVVGTLTGAEIAGQTQPFIEIGPDPCARIKDYPLAVCKVRYQGEPVMAVVAESPSLADDAAELVQVEYEALDPVLDAETALTDKSILHAETDTNRVWNGVFEYGDVDQAFREAAYVVKIDRMHFHRFSSTPLENNVVIAQWNPKDDRLYYECNNSFHSVSRGASWRPHRSDTGRDLRHRWQFRHQDHELSANGRMRAGFKENRWKAGQVGGNALRAPYFERSWQRADFPRHASCPQ
jgi:2-furoyl-CoA dehydrogenase large subunit